MPFNIISALALFAAVVALLVAVYEHRRITNLGYGQDALAKTLDYCHDGLRAQRAITSALVDAVCDDFPVPSPRPDLYVVDGEALAGDVSGRRAELVVVS